MKKLLLLLLFIPLVSFGQDWNCVSGDCENGKGKMYSSDGIELYEGEFMNGKKHGQGRYRTNLYVYEGGWKNDKQHGQGTINHIDGDKYSGGWMDGVFHGRGIFTVSDGSRFEGEYKNGKRTGYGTFFYSERDIGKNGYGSLLIGEWENSELVTPFSDESVKYYLDNKIESLDRVEGIYSFRNNKKDFTFLILYEDGKYNGYIMKPNSIYEQRDDLLQYPGHIKFEMNKTAESGVFDVLWKYNIDVDDFFINTFLVYRESEAVLKLEERAWWSGAYLLKSYPTFEPSNINKNRTGEWTGNGSGIIISKSGYIITNHHVVEDANDIEVEFILNDEIQKFNSEIVQVDKVNDLAIIKIFDMNFDGVSELPYNFKIRSADVGTKVYAYGYPMALSIMGKEIKVTDGMISSKSGFDGDITTYQITAPIQEGNSGGPLFDEKGNLLGINSSGIRKDVADNVAYTIKSSYIVNLIDVMPKNIDLPSNTKLQSLPLTEQIKEISKYVVLIKVK